jgi:hypothetical protein
MYTCFWIWKARPVYMHLNRESTTCIHASEYGMSLSIFVKHLGTDPNKQQFARNIMNRKFKQWWSTILPIFTMRTIAYHLNSLQKCDGVKPFKEIQPPPLDNWISNGNATVAIITSVHPYFNLSSALVIVCQFDFVLNIHCTWDTAQNMWL